MVSVEIKTFSLKKMYEGITLPGLPVITNQNLTEDLVVELVAKHPRGFDLFYTIIPLQLIKTRLNAYMVLIENESFQFSDVNNAFKKVLGRTPEKPTPFKYQEYYKKLSKKRKTQIFHYLKQPVSYAGENNSGEVVRTSQKTS